MNKTKGIFLSLLLVGIIIVSGCVKEESSTGTIAQTGQKTETVTKTELITKTISEMLPTREDIPTEWTIDSPKNLIANLTGFEDGKTLEITKIGKILGSTAEAFVVDFNIYKFSSVNDAKSFFNNEVSRIKQIGGYTELKSSVNAECFAYKTEYGYEAKFANNLCIRKNIVFGVDATLSYTLEKPETYLNSMIKILDKKIN